jgi:hypothetical protein
VALALAGYQRPKAKANGSAMHTAIIPTLAVVVELPELEPGQHTSLLEQQPV